MITQIKDKLYKYIKENNNFTKLAVLTIDKKTIT
jgi:hypothetical protein